MTKDPGRSRGLRRVRGTVVSFAMLAGSAVARDARAADTDPWIARDKALHFDACAGLAAAGYGVSAGWLVDARWKALAVGGGVALVAGAAKELADAAGVIHGDPSWRDFAWDAMGAVAGLALAWSVDMLLGGVDQAHPALAAPTPDVARAGVLVRF